MKNRQKSSPYPGHRRCRLSPALGLRDKDEINKFDGRAFSSVFRLIRLRRRLGPHHNISSNLEKKTPNTMLPLHIETNKVFHEAFGTRTGGQL